MADVWAREHFVPGAGAPGVLWFVFGRFDAVTLRALPALAESLPPGVEVRSVVRNDPEYPHFLMGGGFLEALNDDFPGLAEELGETGAVVRIEGSVQDASTLVYLAQLIEGVASLLRDGGLALADPIAFKWWSNKAFHEQLLKPGRAMPFQHVSILASPEEGRSAGTTWMHTRGMRLFGRPDVSLRQVADEEIEVVTEIFNRFIELAVRGAVVPEGFELRMPGLSSALRCHHRGALDDPHFNNLHLLLTRV